HTEALVADVDLSNVESRSGEQLESALRAYLTEEAPVSARRREVQRVVDTLNAEIGCRYASGTASVDELLAEQRQLTDPPT
ncbi:MAG: aerial mycelium formation protein, partial [Pseudonocardiaceae bacterium]